MLQDDNIARVNPQSFNNCQCCTLFQSGGMEIMEMEVKRRMGVKSTWKQYAFQMVDSNLQYFSKIDKVKSNNNNVAE